MASAFKRAGRLATVLGGATAFALVAAGCASSPAPAGTDAPAAAGGAITVGTTDKISSIDPAGSYDNGSFVVMNQIYPFLLNSKYGTAEVTPDIAESAEFTGPNEYTVKLKEGLTFANGNELTSSDVKFSFDRVVSIADENGPSSLLYNLDSVATPDDLTVVFTLKEADDQIFPLILSSPAAPIVDEDVFDADAVTPDDKIVSGRGFAGQYEIDSFKLNSLISYKKFEGYQGNLGEAENDKVAAKYYADASNLKLDIQENNIDVAFRSLSATDIDDLRKNDKVQIVDGPGGEIRYITFNFNSQPYGATTADADAAKALAVRQAVADLLDRDELAKNVYKGTYTPLYGFVPADLLDGFEPLKEPYGDGKGGADAGKAKERLEAAGITGPVDLNLQYSNDHYGPGSADEYGLIKEQLEADGLFKVNLQTTEWVQYTKDRTSDVYPAYQLGWFPDYSDADTYLTPFFLKENFLGNHYDNPVVNDMIVASAGTTDKDARTQLLKDIQTEVAKDLSTLPYLQGSQIAVTGKDISGTADTLDASFKFRYGALSKG